MATLSIFEKYPGSYRIDHPDFGDVSKTIYGKGVITEFQKGDDPLSVLAMVKVTGSWGGSEFIPLFFNPKAKYWDAPGVLATDFDKANGYFKQAWQSFRGGDEAVVMLKEGVPVAVMGFADGVPRIGEDIIEIHTETFVGEQHKSYIQCSKKGIPYLSLDAEALGLDGKTLNLLKESILLCRAQHWDDPVVHPKDYYYIGDILYWNQQTDYDGDLYLEWLITVGPLCYIIQTFGHYQRTFYDSSWPGPEVPHGYGNYYCLWSGMVALKGIYSQELYNATIQKGSANSALNPNDINNGWVSSGARGYWLSYPGFTYDDVFTQNLWSNTALTNNKTDQHAFDPDKFAFKVRPHTKAELQAAGMWPQG